MRTDVAAVIVTYYSAGQIEECLRSLRDVAEVVVVDNGSKGRNLRDCAPHGP